METVTCCACLKSADLSPIEHHQDHFDSRQYRMFRCPHCGVVFAQPAVAVGAQWYEKAVPLEPSLPAEKDPRFAAFFRDIKPSAGKLLDIGCGDGQFLLEARKRGFAECVGFDYDPRKTQEARKKGLDAHTDDWISFCRSRGVGEFGVITLFDVLEHVPDPVSLMREVHRMLAIGGHAVITLPNADRPMPFGREDYDFPPHHFTRWSPGAMRKFLEREGFSIVRQDAGGVELRYVLDVMVSHCAVKPAIRLAKKIFFGATSDGGSLTELYARQTSQKRETGQAGESASRMDKSWRPRNLLAGKQLRSSLFGIFTGTSKALFYVPAAIFTGCFKFLRRDSGHSLYTLSVKS